MSVCVVPSLLIVVDLVLVTARILAAVICLLRRGMELVFGIPLVAGAGDLLPLTASTRPLKDLVAATWFLFGVSRAIFILIILFRVLLARDDAP